MLAGLFFSGQNSVLDDLSNLKEREPVSRCGGCENLGISHYLLLVVVCIRRRKCACVWTVFCDL